MNSEAWGEFDFDEWAKEYIGREGYLIYEPQAPQELPIEPTNWDTEQPRIEEALSYIPADNRNTWFAVMCGIHDCSGGSEEGWEVFDAWSQTGANYSKKENRRQWEYLGDRQNPITVASVYRLAIAYGWTDGARLPSDPLSVPPEMMASLFKPGKLTGETMKAVREKFKSYRPSHNPSEETYRCLEQIALAIEQMAEGRLASNFWVSALSTGEGKTTVLEQAVKRLLETKEYDHVGVIVFLERRDQVPKLAKEMGLLGTSDYTVVVSPGVEVEIDGRTVDVSELGRRDDPTQARVLFTTQEGLRVRGSDCKPFGEMTQLFYKGKPRQVRVWDETAIPNKTMTVDRDDIAGMFKTFRKHKKPELADELEDFHAHTRQVDDHSIVTVPDISEKYDISVEDVRNWFEKGLIKDKAEQLIKLSGKLVRVRKEPTSGSSILDWEDVLPTDLMPMLILDASAQHKVTYHYWHEYRKNLLFLPYTTKSYEPLTIHHWDRGAGKKAHAKDGNTIAEGVAKTINTEIPQDEKVLVVHFIKSTYVGDMQAKIGALLEGNKDRISYTNWGRHTATNDFCDHRYVILAGILQYGVAEYEAIGRGAKGIKTEEDFPEGDHDVTRLGEIKHNIFQAACRGHVRHSEGDKCPPGCHLYVIYSTHIGTGVPRALLEEVFPSAQVVDWKPVYTLKKKSESLVKLLINDKPTWTKADLAEALGIKLGNLTRYLNDDDMHGWLSENGYKLDIRHSDVELVRGNGAGSGVSTTKKRATREPKVYNWNNLPF